MALALVGLLAMIRGVLLLLVPEFFGKMIDKFVLQDEESRSMKLHLASLVLFPLSFAILYYWWLL